MAVTPPLDEIRALYDKDQRWGARIPGTRREEAAGTVRFINLREGEGFVLGSRLDEASADRAIAATMERFREAAQEVEWKVFDYDEPTDLRARLIDAGFVEQAPEALVVLDLSDLAERLAAPVTADVRLVTDAAGFDGVRDVHKAVSGRDYLPWLTNALEEEVEGDPDGVSVWLVYCDGVPTTTGWMRTRNDASFASLWSGSTLEAYRGRGLYTALVAARVQEARRRGYRYACVEAGPNSLPILHRLGFRDLAMIHPCCWKPTTQRSSARKRA